MTQEGETQFVDRELSRLNLRASLEAVSVDVHAGRELRDEFAVLTPRLHRAIRPQVVIATVDASLPGPFVMRVTRNVSVANQ